MIVHKTGPTITFSRLPQSIGKRKKVFLSRRKESRLGGGNWRPKLPFCGKASRLVQVIKDDGLTIAEKGRIEKTAWRKGGPPSFLA